MKIARNGFPRRALAILMALLLTVQLLPAALAAEDGEGASEENSSDTVPGPGDSMSIDGQAQDAATATGTAGEDVTWSYYADTTTLVLSGAGATDDYTKSVPPWYTKTNDENDYQTLLTNVVIENGVTRLGNRLFINAKKLTSIAIAGSVTEIGDKVFMNCTALPSITIPDGVESVGENAFNGCTSLTEVKLPASLETIGDGAFTKCASLASIQYAGTVAQYQALAEQSEALQSADYRVTCSDGTSP